MAPADAIAAGKPNRVMLFVVPAGFDNGQRQSSRRACAAVSVLDACPIAGLCRGKGYGVMRMSADNNRVAVFIVRSQGLGEGNILLVVLMRQDNNAVGSGSFVHHCFDGVYMFEGAEIGVGFFLGTFFGMFGVAYCCRVADDADAFAVDVIVMIGSVEYFGMGAFY